MKLFASDYDGTFFKHQHRKRLEVKKNIEGVMSWQEAGNLFVFATGRSISLMNLERKFRKLRYDYIVGLNGGIIVSKTGEILFQATIKPEVAQGVVELIEKQGINNYTVTDGLTGHFKIPFNWRKKSSYLFKLLMMSSKAYRLSLEAALKQPVAQIAVETVGHEEAIAFAKLVNETFKNQVTAFANLHHVDISAPNVSKATGVAAVAKIHQIKNEDIYGMGDSHNDVPMFKEFNGLTLPEAHLEIKEQADAVYETVGSALSDILLKSE